MTTPSPATISTSTGKTAMAISALSASFVSSASKNQPFQRLTVTLAKTLTMIAAASRSDQNQARRALAPRQKPPVSRAKRSATCRSPGRADVPPASSFGVSTVDDIPPAADAASRRYGSRQLVN